MERGGKKSASELSYLHRGTFLYEKGGAGKERKLALHVPARRGEVTRLMETGENEVSL